MKKYLAASEYIDWRTPTVLAKAKELSSGSLGSLGVAQRCFEFVRDVINHSWDYKQGPVTCRASGFLKRRAGYGYAKSHLLAELLHAN